jgi:hypothetical protein
VRPYLEKNPSQKTAWQSDSGAKAPDLPSHETRVQTPRLQQKKKALHKKGLVDWLKV